MSPTLTSWMDPVSEKIGGGLAAGEDLSVTYGSEMLARITEEAINHGTVGWFNAFLHLAVAGFTGYVSVAAPDSRLRKEMAEVSSHETFALLAKIAKDMPAITTTGKQLVEGVKRGSPQLIASSMGLRARPMLKVSPRYRKPSTSLYGVGGEAKVIEQRSGVGASVIL